METRTVRYQTSEDMEIGVEHMKCDGWILSKVRQSPDGAISAEFERLTEVLHLEVPEAAYPTA